jgi:drug/metabolite transporter (DMT)-like permease
MPTLLNHKLLAATLFWVGNQVAQAQPTSIPTKVSQDASPPLTPTKVLQDASPRNLSPYLTVTGYAMINVGLFYGVHALHAATDEQEEHEHVVFDSVLADSLVLTGLTSLGVGYVTRQKALGEELLAPRLFWGTTALAGASTALLYSLAFALRESNQEISSRATFVGTLSLSFAVGSLTTALALRHYK